MNCCLIIENLYLINKLINHTMTQIQFQNSLTGLHSKLYYFALSLTSDSDKARDLVQETYLKALTYRDKFSADTNLMAWVYTIMKKYIYQRIPQKRQGKDYA